MNKNLTEIAYILDRSGSMEPMVEPAIAGFNQFLREQREAPGQARLTLVLSHPASVANSKPSRHEISLLAQLALAALIIDTEFFSLVHS